MDREIREVLVFEVAGQRHGISASAVQELLPALTIMPVPGAQACIEGVINLHGRIVPVVSVRSRFGLPTKDLCPSEHFIVIRCGERLIALHVDRALDLVEAPSNAWSDVGELYPEMLAGRATDTARVMKWRDGMVLVYPVEYFDLAMEAVSA